LPDWQIEDECGAGTCRAGIDAGEETAMGGILPSKLTVRSSAMIANSKTAHLG
jgi:hypothetical protein